MDEGDIGAFLDFLRPRLAERVMLGFYGGEPLLNWPLIEWTIGRLRRSPSPEFHFSLTSNGSLLTEERILFLRENRCELIISYDGLAQAFRDPGSVGAVQAALGNLRTLYPHGYLIHSVFTPRTVSLLAASLGELLRQGHGRLLYTLDMITPWKAADLLILEEQLGRLARVCRKHHEKTGRLPLENLRRSGSRGIFACFAGRDRLALLPDRTIWGCYMFYDLLGHARGNQDYMKYCFGRLEDFKSEYDRVLPAIGAHYADLRQDFFFNEKKELCSLCADLENCSACPVVAALATGVLAVIPSWTCRIKRITRAAEAKFRRRGGPG